MRRRPTTIFTIGILLTGSWRTVRWLLVVPRIWAGVGGSAAFVVGVPQDLALIAALLLVILFSVARLSGMRFARQGDGNAA